MTLDDWNTFLQVLSVALIGLTFAVAAAAFIVAYRVGKKQDARIADAASNAAFASNEAAGANARAADAVMRSQRLEIEAGVQRERAAKAEKELLELQDRARPRVLNDAARSALVRYGALTQEPFSMKFVSGSTAEPVNFAMELKAALTAAGWVISSISGGPALGRPPSGLLIQFSNAEPPPNWTSFLQGALEAAGLPAQFEPRTDMKPNEVVLMVGLKP